MNFEAGLRVLEGGMRRNHDVLRLGNHGYIYWTSLKCNEESQVGKLVRPDWSTGTDAMSTYHVYGYDPGENFIPLPVVGIYSGLIVDSGSKSPCNSVALLTPTCRNSRCYRSADESFV